MSDPEFHGEIDFYYQFLEEVADLLDDKLDKVLVHEANDCPDPDSFGIYDRAEYVAGLGFVECQEYLAAVIGPGGKDKKERQRLLALGPTRGAFSIAHVLDAAANYWKHKGEGALNPQTASVFAGIGVDPFGEYPVFHVLRYLQGDFPSRFRAVVPWLAAWREAVQQDHAAGGPQAARG